MTDEWQKVKGELEDAQAVKELALVRQELAQAKAGLDQMRLYAEQQYAAAAQHRLTDEEVALIELCFQVYKGFISIIGTGTQVAVTDLTEVATHVHALQNMVLAQCAARVYPGNYRLLGRALGDVDG